ncbi:MAG: 7TM diverse intracellular signaling domain-containing protein [Polyangiaceae bacterium]
MRACSLSLEVPEFDVKTHVRPLRERLNAWLRARRGWLSLFMLVALTCVSLLLGAREPSSPGVLRLESGWTYRWTTAADRTPLLERAGAPIELPAHPKLNGEVLWLQLVLPSGGENEPYIAIDAVRGPFEAYVEGEKALEFPQGGISARAPPGLPWQLIPLPHGYAGKRLSLRIAAPYEPAGVSGTPLLGDRSALLEAALKRDLPRLVTGLCIALLGLFAVVGVGASGEWPMRLGFAGYAWSFSLYLVNSTHLKQFVAYAPAFWFVVWLAALVLNPLAGLVFLTSLFRTASIRRLRQLRTLHVGLALAMVVVISACWIGYQAGPETSRLAAKAFYVALNVIRLALLVTAVTAVAWIARHASRGDRDARTLLFGVGCVLAFAIRDFLAAAGVAQYSTKSDLYIGVLCLMVTLFVIVQRRYQAVHARALELALELRERAQEKELMLRDLHDGIGALTSNVSMLAEVGSRRADRAQTALEGIKRLTSTALAELRAFVRTSGDQPLSWLELCAELRSYAARLAEVQGREFEMTVRAESQIAVSSSLGLGFSRIFREAITNASKQVGGSFVRVRLEVSPEELRFEVENDGQGLRSDGVNAGLGLPNLRARAADLGGSLEFQSGDTPRLTLLLPLPHKPPPNDVHPRPVAG